VKPQPNGCDVWVFNPDPLPGFLRKDSTNSSAFVLTTDFRYSGTLAFGGFGGTYIQRFFPAITAPLLFQNQSWFAASNFKFSGQDYLALLSFQLFSYAPGVSNMLTDRPVAVIGHTEYKGIHFFNVRFPVCQETIFTVGTDNFAYEKII